jgi:tetratricopeptide (TPR) repeat protein
MRVKQHKNIGINIVVFLVLFSSAVKSKESSNVPWKYRVFRPITSAQLKEAQDARDAADLMLEKCRVLYLVPSAEDFKLMAKDPVAFKNRPPSEQQINDYKKVISAFQSVVDKYKGTEIAGYCQRRISLAYQFQGQHAEVVKQDKIASEIYAGTIYESRAYISIGLLYLQGLHEPSKAIEWFEKVHKPDKEHIVIPEDQYNYFLSFYISAQTSIIRCMTELDKAQDAIKRVEELSQEFPEQKENLIRELESFLDNEQEKRSRSNNTRQAALESLSKQTVLQIEKDVLTTPPAEIAVIDPTEDVPDMKEFTNAEKAEYEKHLSLLKMRWNIVAERSKDVDEAIAKLGAMGDKVVEPIMYEYNRLDQDYLSFRHQAVRVLAAVKSTKARQALLKIALGGTMGDNDSQKGWASSRYIASLDDKSEANKLLVSNVSGVLNNALVALIGQPVDEKFLSRLAEILGLEIKGLSELTLCWNIASIIAADPNSQYALEKVSVIIKAVDRVPKIPKAEEIYPRTYLTYAELTYGRYIEALSKIKDANDYLKEQLPRVKGNTLYCIFIALANRGDSSVKSSLVAILQDKDAEMFRTWSARFFGTFGTPDDIQMLQKLADFDPLERETGSDMPLPQNQKTFFPVRWAAQAAIKEIEKKAR